MSIDRGFILIVNSQTLGRGDDELGYALTVKLLQELATGSAAFPEKIFFLNSGVKLLTSESAALPHLRRLEDAGVELQACGTCLEWFELSRRIVAGKETNMARIVAELSVARKAVSL